MEVRKGRNQGCACQETVPGKDGGGFGWRLRPDPARNWHRISASTKKEGQISRVTVSVQL